MRVLARRVGASLAPLSVCFWQLGCAGQAPQAAKAGPAGSRSPGEPSLSDQGWGVLRSATYGLKLALPEARSWVEAEPRSRGSWELRHEPTGSTLSLRRWRASRLPQVGACELELRQRTPGLPEVDETNLVARREVHAPEGFVTQVTLLSLPGKDARFTGQVLAVGAGVGECLAAIANTDSAGEPELAERLRLLDVALGHIRITHIEDRVPKAEPHAH